MSFEVEGKLHKVFESEQKTDTFRTREFVIAIEQGNYPQVIKFQLVQDRCEAIDNFNEGDRVKVFFDLRGREWQGKYFTNLQAWRIEPADASSGASPLDTGFSSDTAPGEASTSEEMRKEDFDDLPF